MSDINITTTKKLLESTYMQEALERKLEPLKSTIEEINTTVDGIVMSISFLSGQYDDLLKKVAKLEEEKKVLAQDYASLKDKTFKIANELQIKKDCCDNMDV